MFRKNRRTGILLLMIITLLCILDRTLLIQESSNNISNCLRQFFNDNVPIRANRYTIQAKSTKKLFKNMFSLLEYR